MHSYLKTYKLLETLGVFGSCSTSVSKFEPTDVRYDQLYLVLTSMAGSPSNTLFTKLYRFDRKVLRDLLSSNHGANDTAGQAYSIIRGTDICLAGIHLEFQNGDVKSGLTKKQLCLIAAQQLANDSLLGQPMSSLSNTIGLGNKKSKKLKGLNFHHLVGCLWVSPTTKPIFISKTELKQAYCCTSQPEKALLRVQKCSFKVFGHSRIRFRKMLLLLAKKSGAIKSCFFGPQTVEV